MGTLPLVFVPDYPQPCFGLGREARHAR